MKTIYISLKGCELNIKPINQVFKALEDRIFDSLGFAQLTVPVDRCVDLTKNEMVEVVAFNKKEKIKGRFMVCDINHKLVLLLSTGALTYYWREW